MKRPMGKIYGSGNVPDDWGNYYRTCDRCGSTYHASEHGCSACDDAAEDEDEWTEDDDMAAQEAADEERRDFLREIGARKW